MPLIWGAVTVQMTALVVTLRERERGGGGGGGSQLSVIMMLNVMQLICECPSIARAKTKATTLNVVCSIFHVCLSV